ncbi:MAG: 50S ribosomal protein L9 [Clostridia bacterium]|nr:50S ribosomal protein L9 [Clostridia bacterium]
MKVILKADVKGSGKKGDVIEVSEGYAKNFLIKKGLAELATATGINEIQQRKKAEAFHYAEEVKAMQALANELRNKEVTVTIRTGANGKVFGSVTSLQIAQALSALGYEVDKKKIQLGGGIKTLGSFPTEIRLMEGISTKITVNVVSEA